MKHRKGIFLLVLLAILSCFSGMQESGYYSQDASVYQLSTIRQRSFRPVSAHKLYKPLKNWVKVRYRGGETPGISSYLFFSFSRAVVHAQRVAALHYTFCVQHCHIYTSQRGPPVYNC